MITIEGGLKFCLVGLLLRFILTIGPLFIKLMILYFLVLGDLEHQLGLGAGFVHFTGHTVGVLDLYVGAGAHVLSEPLGKKGQGEVDDHEDEGCQQEHLQDIALARAEAAGGS